jgi:hypothetical protein
MASCHELKVGQVLVCEDCGLELKVVKACEECSEEEGECSLAECQFQCCGEEMKVKEG